MRISNELQKGKAGEYLVCADLILKGFVAYPSEQGLPYDVVLDNGQRLLKIQVKSTQGLRVVPQRSKDTKCYIFNVKRHGKNQKSRYSSNEVDLFALVCLESRKIGYLLNEDMPDTINFRCETLRGMYYDEKGLRMYQQVMELKKTMNQTEISKKIGCHVSVVNRMCKPDYEPFLTNARYFTDIERQREWFIGL